VLTLRVVDRAGGGVPEGARHTLVMAEAAGTPPKYTTVLAFTIKPMEPVRAERGTGNICCCHTG